MSAHDVLTDEDREAWLRDREHRHLTLVGWLIVAWLFAAGSALLYLGWAA